MNHYIHMLRDEEGSYYTYGKLTFYNFKCDTMEDEGRPFDAKKPKETRIYAGHHEILLRKAGGMHTRYLNHPNPRIKEIHEGMLWLQDTPQFEWIYIHPGTTHLHTDGCILPGYSRGIHEGLKAVFRSVDAYVDLYKMVVAYIKVGDRVFIDVRDPVK
jgi:hypothetical protein